MQQLDKLENESISFCFEYTLLKTEPVGMDRSESCEFKLTHQSGRATLLQFSYASGTVLAAMDGIIVPKSTVDELLTLGRFDGHLVSLETKGILEAPLREIRTSVRNLLALLKYHLRHYYLEEGGYSVKSEQWCNVRGDRFDLPTSAR